MTATTVNPFEVITFVDHPQPVDYGTFEPDTSNIIYTPNGSMLHVTAKRHTIGVFDSRVTLGRDGWLYGFRANVWTNSDGENELDLYIRTRDTLHGMGKRHPDIQPAELLRLSVAYFDRINLSPDLIICDWLMDERIRTNWLQYRRYLEAWHLRQLGMRTEEQKRQAAAATWSGRLVTRAGFGDIRGVDDEDYDRVVVEFYRNQAPAIIPPRYATA